MTFSHKTMRLSQMTTTTTYKGESIKGSQKMTLHNKKKIVIRGLRCLLNSTCAAIKTKPEWTGAKRQKKRRKIRYHANKQPGVLMDLCYAH